MDIQLEYLQRPSLSFFHHALASMGPSSSSKAQIETLTVSYVDINRFMGPWYVQGHPPLFVDDFSTNQIETYKLNPDGSIAVKYEFERFGKTFVMHPEGQVLNRKTQAHWSMQFSRFVSVDYLIVRLSEDYSWTVVSVPSQKLTWIMSRSPILPEALYSEIIEDLRQDGYAVDLIRRVPQHENLEHMQRH